MLTVAGSPRKPITFLLDVGGADDHRTLGGSGPNFPDATHRCRDAVRSRGYRVLYAEIPGGVHAPSTWRMRLPSGIMALSADWPR